MSVLTQCNVATYGLYETKYWQEQEQQQQQKQQQRVTSKKKIENFAPTCVAHLRSDDQAFFSKSCHGLRVTFCWNHKQTSRGSSVWEFGSFGGPDLYWNK